MHTSAFGVEHWETVSKEQSHRERAEGYRRNKRDLATIGGLSAGLGTGSAIVGHMERQGKDPMGFVSIKEKPRSPKVKPAVRARVLGANAKAHGIQSKVAAGVAAGSLGLAGAYRHAEKKEWKKQFGKADTKRKVRDAATDVGTVGVGGGAIWGGNRMRQSLGPAAKAHGKIAYHSIQGLRGAKQGHYELGPIQEKWLKGNRKVATRVAGVKGAGTAASVGVMGLGAKAIYDTGKRNLKEHEKVNKALADRMLAARKARGGLLLSEKALAKPKPTVKPVNLKRSN